MTSLARATRHRVFVTPRRARQSIFGGGVSQIATTIDMAPSPRYITLERHTHGSEFRIPMSPSARTRCVWNIPRQNYAFNNRASLRITLWMSDQFLLRHRRWK